jgi:XTP/dITP diphosphohydrolase
MSQRLIQVASSNQGKLAEIMLGVELWQRARGRKLSSTIELLPGFAGLPRCEETESTFAGNARKKAKHYRQLAADPTTWVLADDSGLVVDSLDGVPGVFSARFAGPNASDAENNRKLLQELAGVTTQRRTARFVCALAIADCDHVAAEFSGTSEGIILEAARGTHGFGYDPLFLDTSSGKAYAELSAEEKMARSHRGKALFALLDWLATQE